MSRERFDKKVLTQVGNRLREVRKAIPMTQEFVMEETKIKVGRYERAESNISMTTLAVLCRQYKITLEEFFRGIEL